MLGVLPFVEDPDLSVSAARATCATLDSRTHIHLYILNVLALVQVVLLLVLMILA